MLQSTRRSSRLNHNGIHSQSRSGLPLDNDQSHASQMVLQLNSLLEGKLIKKDDLLTKEYDTDYIDEFIAPNLSDDLYNIHEIDKKTLEKTTSETDKENMLQKVEDEDL